MSLITIKRGDTKRGIQCTLLDPSGNAVDLTNCNAKFNLGAKIVGGLAVVLDPPTDGKVLYALEANAVNECGLFKAEFEVTYADGRTETFPNQKYLLINIIPDLG